MKGRRGVIYNSGFLRETVLGQARLQRLVTVETFARIQKKLRRASQQKSQVFGRALEAVVEHSQNLFVVRSSCLLAVELVEVHHFVKNDQKSFVTGLLYQKTHELETAVKRVV